MSERLVHCRLLKKDLPGLARPPFRNDLGRRLYEEVSKDGWAQWLKDSVRFVNTYRVDLASSEGQQFMVKQCSIYFGYEQGDLAQTAWTPGSPGGPGAPGAPAGEGAGNPPHTHHEPHEPHSK